MRFTCLVALLSCAALAGPTASAGEDSLFTNGGFEDGIAGWRPLNMSGHTRFAPDKKVKSEGEQSLRIEKSGPGRPDFLKQSATLPASKGDVEVSIQYRVDKKSRLKVDVYFFDEAGETVGKGYMKLVLSGHTKKRFKKAKEKYEIPDGATGVGINVIMAARGTAWIDDLVVKGPGSRGPKEPVGLANGGFEDGLAGWAPLPFGSDTTKASADKKKKKAGKAALRLVRDNHRLYPEDGMFAEVRGVEGGRAKLSFHAHSKDDIRCAVVIQAFDASGTCVGTERVPVSASSKRSFAKDDLELKLPGTTRLLRVSLVVQGRGTAWFDELALEVK